MVWWNKDAWILNSHRHFFGEEIEITREIYDKENLNRQLVAEDSENVFEEWRIKKALNPVGFTGK